MCHSTSKSGSTMNQGVITWWGSIKEQIFVGSLASRTEFFFEFFDYRPTSASKYINHHLTTILALV